MNRSSVTLTVLFDAPFWVGVFERVEDNKLTVAKVIFGAEPKDYEIYDFILKNFYRLKFSPSLIIENNRTFENPKRKQRAARKQMQKTGIGTKSQQALQLQLEARKIELKNFNKVQQAVLKQHQFELKKQNIKKNIEAINSSLCLHAFQAPHSFQDSYQATKLELEEFHQWVEYCPRYR